MQDIVKALTWTFIHSLWQGLLAALLSAIIFTPLLVCSVAMGDGVPTTE